VSVCPEGALTLVDVEEDGLRPRVSLDACAHCGECLKVCPGANIEAGRAEGELIPELRAAWGPVLEVWEGFAADPEIRFHGSSGGIATALSLFCLEKRRLSGIVHAGPSPANPLANTAVTSRNRVDLMARTGSRYAPAAPCTALGSLGAEGAPYVFVGKPCDVVAVRKWQTLNPESAERIEAAISIFCAGTPNTQGTRRILEELSVRPDEVADIRYRGKGWPGCTTVTMNGESHGQRSMSYEESWGNILSKHTQFRCRLCPDATGELADISCGDPWYRRIEPEDPGRSLVLVRTETGREIVREALREGYVQLEPVAPDALPKSQRSLLLRRRHLWGRILALRMFRVPVPRYQGFSLFANWRTLSARDKLRSLFGTIYRIRQRKWNRPLGYESHVG
jgi:coenzyme F420 hydrogenase subunit beta